MLSVIIITKNEAEKIRHCLESVSFADEIVIVDSGSDDDTLSICREYTDHIYHRDWTGFGPQKNFALAKASQPWVLSVDADERVTDELREEICRIIQSSAEITAWQMPRLSNFCGNFIRHSGWYPDYVLRLFRRESARFSDAKVHEKVIAQGPTRRLHNHLLHYPMDQLEQSVKKLNLYSSIAAEEKFANGASASLSKAISRGLWTFLRCYILKAGFLDGRGGFVLASANAQGTYYKYVKLMYLAQQNSLRADQTSLIITTYNWPAALTQVLHSAGQQNSLPKEVIIADDGSRDDTRELIDSMRADFPVPLVHVWQADDGHQGSRIRNKAAAAATGDYLIFIDGDCILRPTFIANHVALAKRRRFVAGNRILFSESFTQEVLNNQHKVSDWPPMRFNKQQVNRRFALFDLPIGLLRHLRQSRWQGVKTCNMSLYRDDFLAVNGFDEAYSGWGFEDSDLVVRLINNGCQRISGRFATTVLHLWHPLQARPENSNWDALMNTLNKGTILPKQGMDDHLPAQGSSS